MTFFDQLRSIAARRNVRLAEDAVQEFLSDDQADPPAEVLAWIDSIMKRLVAKYQKRASRETKRNRKLYDERVASSANSSEFDLDEVVSTIGGGRFAEDVVRVYSGVHPEFITFAEVARSGRHGGRSQAYRLKSVLDRRLRATLSNDGEREASGCR